MRQKGVKNAPEKFGRVKCRVEVRNAKLRRFCAKNANLLAKGQKEVFLEGMQKNKPKTKIPEGCVSSREELAVELEISARWLDALRKQPGAPEMVQGKYYDVEAWKEFREQEKARRDEEKGLSEKDKKELAKAHLRRDKAIAEKEELKLEQLKGSLIETTAVKMEFQSAWTFELSCLKSALASYPKLTPADASQIFDDFVKLCREYKTELINHAESQSEI